jgi:hypothetical protein
MRDCPFGAECRRQTSGIVGGPRQNTGHDAVAASAEEIEHSLGGCASVKLEEALESFAGAM